MATNFSDEARDLLAPVMSDDLSTYLSGIGQMFAQVEEYAREDAGPVYLGPLIPEPTTRGFTVGTSIDAPWWFYYSQGIRGTAVIDASVELEGEPSIRVHPMVADSDRIGVAIADVPIAAGQSYRWRGVLKGLPNESYLISVTAFQQQFASGGSTSLGTTVVTDGNGFAEFDHTFTIPANRAYLYAYVLSPLVTPGSPSASTDFFVSRKTSLYRVSTAAPPVTPWAKLLNPEAAVNEAALLYLAQLAGVRVPQGMKFRDMQTFIERAEARRRGRLSYMVELAQATLTGNKFVFTIEREPTAWVLRMVTRLSETPDPAATEAAILRGKPAGIVLDYEAVAGITWDEAVSQWNATGLTWDESSDTVP